MPMASDQTTGVSSTEFHSLQTERDRLIVENQRLRELLDAHGITDPKLAIHNEDENESSKKETADADVISAINKYSASEDKIELFLSLFCGRDDIYAKQWQSKDGKIGYSPACKNEWVSGVCGKPKVKCASCSHAVYYAYDSMIINRHLRGECVVGIYPLLQDDTCNFLAIDFDEVSWHKDIRIVAETCKKNNVPFPKR